MKCAIMQPYLFPYLGYYQLVYASDCFVVYDDVNYIKRGFINRNTIELNGFPHRFTLPVESASINKLINELSYTENTKILETIKRAYSKAPYFNESMVIIEKVLKSKERSVSKLNALSITEFFKYLDIDKKLMFSTEMNYDRSRNRADRLIEISKLNKCEQYINTAGGKELYNKNHFRRNGVELSFISPKHKAKEQKNSIIDLIMKKSKNEIKELLSEYELS